MTFSFIKKLGRSSERCISFGNLIDKAPH